MRAIRPSCPTCCAPAGTPRGEPTVMVTPGSAALLKGIARFASSAGTEACRAWTPGVC